MGIELIELPLRVCRDNKDNKDNYYENMFAEYIWTFQYNTSIKNKIYPYKRNLKNNMRVNKKISKYSLSDEYLGSFHTYELRDHGFKTKTILMCCNNKLKTSQGFTWKFEISEKFSDII